MREYGTKGRWVKPALLALLVLPALGLCGCLGGGASGTSAAATTTEAPEEAEDDAIAVKLAAVQREAMSALYTTSARLRAERRATVTARTPGIVRELLVEEGDIVRAGQELAILEDDEQRIEFARTRDVRDTRVRELERARTLHEQGMVAEEEFETTRREAEVARHDASLAELRLQRTVIRAPFAGVVLSRHLDPGATVADGTSVYDVADLDPLYTDIQIPERHVGRMAPGQSVRLVADASGDTAQANIERIAPGVDGETGTVKVTLAIAGRNRLRPGSFVRGEIVTDTHAQALVVPRSALVAEGRRWLVYRLTSDGETVERLEVVRGYEEGNLVEILHAVDPARALAVGDRVVVLGASALTDGARIRVEEAGEAAEDDGVTGVAS